MRRLILILLTIALAWSVYYLTSPAACYALGYQYVQCTDRYALAIIAPWPGQYTAAVACGMFFWLALLVAEVSDILRRRDEQQFTTYTGNPNRFMEQ